MTMPWTSGLRRTSRVRRHTTHSVEHLEGRQLLSGSVLAYAAPAGTALDVTLKLQGQELELLNSKSAAVLARQDIAQTIAASVAGAANQDSSLTVDYSGGMIGVPITYDGGAGSGVKALHLTGGDAATEVNSPIDAHSGTITMDGNPIVYSHLTPISDDTPAANYVINATAGNDNVTISDGTQLGGIYFYEVHSDNGTFETVSFAEKTNVTINGIAGNDFFTYRSFTAATGLQNFTINTGTGNSHVSINATAAGVSTNVVSGGTTNTVDVTNDGFYHFAGPVSIQNPSNLTNLFIDDTMDTVGRTATISTTQISGLYPSPVNFASGSLNGLTVSGGSGGNTFTINQAPAPGFAAPFVLHSGSGNDTINVAATRGASSVDAQGGNDTFHVGNAAGSLAGIQGALSLNGNVGTNTAVFDDHGDNPHSYGVTGTTLSRPGAALMTFGSLASTTIICGAGGNTITVNAPTSTAGVMTLHSGADSDTVNVQAVPFMGTLNIDGDDGILDTVNIVGTGSGLQSIGGNVNITNDRSLTSVNVNDSADTTARGVTLGTYTPAGDSPWGFVSGVTGPFAEINYRYSDVMDVTVNTGTGANSVNVQATGGNGTTAIADKGNDHVLVTGTTTPLSITGQNADDVTVDFSGIHVITGSISLAGGAGPTSLTLVGAAATDAFSVGSALITRGSEHISYSGVQTLKFDAGVFGVTQNLNGINVSASGAGTAVNLTVSQTLGALNVTGGAVMTLAHSPSLFLGKLLTEGSLSIVGPGSKLDLNNNEMRLSYSPGNGPATAAAIRALLRSASLTSSDATARIGYALGYADSADAAVAGHGLPPNVVDVRYTLRGDLNLDGVVNFNDLLALSQHYGAAPNAVWDQGDSNYDGSVNFSDLLALAQNYGLTASSAPALDSAVLLSAVPTDRAPTSPKRRRE